MINLYKTKIKINESYYNIVQFNYDLKEDEVSFKCMDIIHHIHVIDRSGSMSYSINELIENVKQTLALMKETDIISLVWFSSLSECKVLLKGAKKSDPSLNQLLDSIKSTLSTTCFSVPLKEVAEIMKDLKILTPNYSITLFTDGQPCCPWTDEEEKRRVMEIIKKDIKDNAVAINTVGYGNNYDRNFLIDIARQSQFGVWTHSNKINEYYKIFERNLETIKDNILNSVEIESPTDIVYLNRTTSKIVNGNEETFKLSAIDKRKNQFFLVMPSEQEFEFAINGEKYNSKDITKSIIDKTLTNFFYTYVYQNYYINNRRKALEFAIYGSKNEYFANKILNSFTFDEVGETINELKAAVVKNEERHTDRINTEITLPKKDAVCVTDILKFLAESENTYYVPVEFSEYKRIGLKTEDKFNLFKKTNKETYTPFNSIEITENKLNISIKSKIDGTVTINPNSAKKVGFENNVFDSYIWRYQTLIKDGTLNIDHMTLLVTQDTLNKLEQKIPTGLITKLDNSPVENTIKIKIDLTTLPVINYSYAELGDNSQEILEQVIALNKLECQQKVVNYYIKQVLNENPEAIKEGQFKNLTTEQINLLNENGIDKFGCYAGIDNQKESKEGKDFYICKILELKLKGCSTIPKVEDIINLNEKTNEKKKKINTNELIMSEFIKELVSNVSNNTTSILAKDFFTKKQKEIKSNITNIKFNLSAIKMAKVLNGDWFKNVTPDGKGNYIFTDSKNLNTLIITPKDKQEYYSK